MAWTLWRASTACEAKQNCPDGAGNGGDWRPQLRWHDAEIHEVAWHEDAHALDVVFHRIVSSRA